MSNMENIIKPFPLEIEIVKWFIQHFPQYKPQLTKAQISRRVYSGVGFFVNYEVPKEIPLVRYENMFKERLVLNGPYIESNQLPNGAGSILFIKGGYIEMLEVYTNVDELPIDLQRFTLKDKSPTG